MQLGTKSLYFKKDLVYRIVCIATTVLLEWFSDFLHCFTPIYCRNKISLVIFYPDPSLWCVFCRKDRVGIRYGACIGPSDLE